MTMMIYAAREGFMREGEINATRVADCKHAITSRAYEILEKVVWEVAGVKVGVQVPLNMRLVENSTSF